MIRVRFGLLPNSLSLTYWETVRRGANHGFGQNVKPTRSHLVELLHSFLGSVPPAVCGLLAFLWWTLRYHKTEVYSFRSVNTVRDSQGIQTLLRKLILGSSLPGELDVWCVCRLSTLRDGNPCIVHFFGANSWLNGHSSKYPTRATG